MFRYPYYWFPDPFFAYAFAILCVILAIVSYFLPKVLERQNSGSPTLVHDRWTFQFFFITAVLSVIIGVACRIYKWGVALGAPQYIGLLFIVLGFVIRNWAIIKLGSFFSHNVTIKMGHRLVTDGPYRWLRHPAYTGLLLVFAGINLALGTWLGALVGLGLVLIAAVYRIHIEEKTLVDVFGDEYREYMQHTWLLMPGW